MQVNSNSSLRTLSQLNSLERLREINSQRLSTGKQINSASDDAAGLAISEKLSSATRQLDRQALNDQDQLSLYQTADGGLSQVGDLLGFIREKVVQAGNGTYTDTERAIIQQDIDNALPEISNLGANTEFNTKKILDGSFQEGNGSSPAISISEVSVNSLGLDQIDVTTEAGRTEALTRLDKALDSVSSERASIGARSNGLTSSIASKQNTSLNILESQSRISDADFARQITEKSRIDILNGAALRAIKIGNDQRKQVLKLLGN